eukprot:GEMP01045987.1.p1 GENE.GEMP01045987.1~~GEMP01045987.1.p1  ORF type:complete len:161 (+),score=20.65 GEMP01045987.1:99-581(+)
MNEALSNAATFDDIYELATESLWSNQIGILEAVLRKTVSCGIAVPETRQGKELRFMSERAEFARIWQTLVQRLQQMMKHSDLFLFKSQAEELLDRCDALVGRQSPEQCCELPGLVTHLDTKMLKTRIRETTVQVCNIMREMSQAKRGEIPLVDTQGSRVM